MPKYFRQVQDPLSSYTHFLGACFAVAALAVFVTLGVVLDRPPVAILSSAIFAASMVVVDCATS